jgi:hypothetical protein
MVICPIARMVHCTGCVLFNICPAKTTLGDYKKEEPVNDAVRPSPKEGQPKQDDKPTETV